MSHPGDLLRARGMRSTPQRRAILAAFEGGGSEHLSADEVLARASRSLPDLSRGTVYATLAEFTEAGLLAAIGSPEPVRYEINTEDHAHFRCRLCLRIFDVAIARPDTDALRRLDYAVERVEIRAAGICRECGEYEAGLRAGVRAMARATQPSPALAADGAAAATLETPVGTLFLAASPQGMIRVGLPEHGDAEAIGRLARRRRAPGPAGDHLRAAAEQIERYFAGEPLTPVCAIDWQTVQGAAELRAPLEIDYAARRSYSHLGVSLAARELGHAYGANPLPLLIPCHRVTRGSEIPVDYVGGPERRAWLLDHERAHAGAGD